MAAHTNYFKEFVKGLRITPADSGPNPVTDDSSINKEGAIYIYSNALKIYLQSALRTIATLDQTQTFTNKTLTSAVLNTSVSGTAVLDEDDMASDSNTQVATQQSIKAYVDAQVTAQDLDTAGDTGTGSVDLDSQSLTVAGGNGIDTAALNQSITVTADIAAGSDIAAGTANKLVDASAVVDEDNMVSDSNQKVPTQQSVKAYVDTEVGTVDGALTTHIADTTTHGTTGDIVGTSDSQTLSNKVLHDDTVSFGDSADVTKKLEFELAGATTSTTATVTSSHTANRTITLPDATDTLVGKATTDTLTNKTIDADGAGNSITNLDTTNTKAAAKTGADTKFVTGTEGTDGNFVSWNADGDAVDSTKAVPTGDVVGTSDSQTLTNKTMAATLSNTFAIGDNADTDKTIEADNGDANNPFIRYNATNDAWEFSNDGTTTSDIGSGGGGGLDDFHTDDIESYADVTGFSTGNNATFLGGGTLDGTLALDTTTEIAGTQSLKYTMGTTSANDYVASPAITLDSKQKGNDIGMSLYFTYNGDDDDIKLVIWDVTNSQDLTDSLALFKSKSNPTRFTAQVFIPTNCATLRWGFQVQTGNSGKILLVDDITLSTNPFVYKDLIDSQELNFSALGSTMTTSGTGVVRWGTLNEVGSGHLSYDDSNGRFTALTDIKQVTVDLGMTRQTGTGVFYVLKNGTSPAAGTTVGQGSAASTCDVGANFTMSKDDYFVIYQGQSLDTTAVQTLGVTVINETAAVVHAKDVGSEWADYTPTFQGFGTPTNLNIRYRRDGSNLLLDVRFDSGTPTSSIARVYLPAGLTVDSNITANHIVGMLARSFNSPNVFTVVARGGNDFVEFGVHTSAANGLDTVSQGSAVAVLGTSVSFFATIPIEGWSGSNYLAVTPLTRTCYLSEQQTVGTNGGTSTSNTIHTRTLNTAEGDTSFVTLSSNQFTLPAGKYLIEGRAPNIGANKNNLFIHDGSSYVLEGENSYEASNSIVSWSTVYGMLEPTTSTTYELRHYIQTGKATNGLGIETNTGINPKSVAKYSQVNITKIL